MTEALIQLKPETLEKAKLYAAENGLTLEVLIEEAVELYVGSPVDGVKKLREMATVQQYMRMLREI